MTSEMPQQKIEGIPKFWTRVQRAKRRVLFLDYDGTLAPFQVERMNARPADGYVELLTNIANSGNTRVAIVSGRPIVELVDLLGTLPVEMVGSHGFEIRSLDGTIRRTIPNHSQSEGLDLAHHRASDAGFEARIERKTASIAFHTRGSMDGSDMNELAKCLWQGFASEFGLELRDFNGGVELRATGSNKGTAIQELLQTESDDALVVYIGDDETDEDAFQAVGTRGIGIKVGGYGIRTAAAGRLPNCEAVGDLLSSWYRLTRVF